MQSNYPGHVDETARDSFHLLIGKGNLWIGTLGDFPLLFFSGTEGATPAPRIKMSQGGRPFDARG